MAALCRIPSKHLLLIRQPRLPRLPFPASFSALAEPTPGAPLPLTEPPPSPSASPRRLKSAVRSTSDPALIFELLRSPGATSTFLRDRATSHLAVEKLARSNRRDLVEQLLEPLQSSSDADERLLARVIALYSSAGMVDHAVRVFEQIPGRTEKSLCALLGAFLENRLPHRAMESFFKESAEIGVVPSIGAWNLYLKAMCEVGDVDGAAEFVLCKMEREKGVQPNLSSYNTLLNAYLKNRDVSSFEKIITDIGNKSLKPDLITYNSRITLLCMKKDLSGAENLFEKMLEEGIKPNLTSYNSLIGGFCKGGDLELAKRWFFKLRDGGGEVAPDGSSYVMVSRLMVEKGEITAAAELCKECLKKRWAPPFDVMRGLVEGLVGAANVKEARVVVSMMKDCVRGSALLAWIKFESTLPL